MDILDKFTGHLKNVLAKSFSLAAESGSPEIRPEHVLLSLLLQKGSIGGEILRKTTMSAEELRASLLSTAPPDGTDDVPRLSSDAKRAVEKAVLTANVNEHKYVGTEHLLAGLLQIGSPGVISALAEQRVDMADLEQHVMTVLKSTSKFPEITETFDLGKAPAKAKEEQRSERRGKPQKAKAKTPALEFFANDLTSPKFQEHVDPVIGRDKEIERLVQILCRRTKNNPVLLGEPGVGKTAIVEGLAKKIIEGDVPEILLGKRIMALDLGLILAGTIYRGEFEGRLKQIVDEVKNNPDLFLFIDELHTIMGAGATNGSLDAANILKPALARGDMRCIGATTLAEYKKHIESDGALERRFQPITVEPPTPEAAVGILKGLRKNYEAYHRVTITDDALEAAVDLSERYLTDRFLPDKAIDLIDEASACLRVAASGENENRKYRELEDELDKVRRKKQKSVTNENFIEALELKSKEHELEREIRSLARKEESPEALGEIGRREIAAVISRSTGIPLSDLLREEKDRLLNLEALLKARVVGQNEAVTAVADLVRRAKAGISNPNRPLASFLFLGPSGVGKTELAKTLAELVFHDPQALLRIDMSEFAEGFTASKLVGAPAGYVGYRDSTKLTDVVKRRPHCLVLFDEIEKAHGDVHNLLLQVLEDGHLTDATGKKINFKNSIIVMTSNVGADRMGGASLGFSTGADTASEGGVRGTAMEAVEAAFRPEFINRIDRIVVFQPLSREHLRGIVGLQFAELAARVRRDYGIGLAAHRELVEHLAEKSWNPMYGARGVRRQIQDLVENPLARALLSETYRSGDALTVGVKEGEVTFAKKKTHAHAKVSHK